jgi:hypothetical protein
VFLEHPICHAISLIGTPRRANTFISTACSCSILGGEKAAIFTQVGQFYSGEVGQYYIGANTQTWPWAASRQNSGWPWPRDSTSGHPQFQGDYQPRSPNLSLKITFHNEEVDTNADAYRWR